MRRLTGRAGLLALAVLTVIAGVVTMHSLGFGHRPMSMADGGHGMQASETHHAASAASHPQGMHAVAAVDVCTSCRTEVVAAWSMPGHGMGAMCLAVLPFLVLLLVRLLARHTRGLARHLLAPGLSASVPSGRAPPAYLRPSLSQLCILRT